MKKRMMTLLVCISVFVSLVTACTSSGNQTPVSDTQSAGMEDSTQSPAVDTNTSGTETKDVPTEYKSALKSAKTYSDMMHMSKQGIYDQLTSEYGGKFTAEAAQYAVDNLDADYKKNALESAKVYQDTMSMSPAAIRDQLVSEYGGKFTEEEADYAVANLN